MSDKLDPISRSELMGRVRARDTKPELIVRTLAHRLGYRFRIHLNKLPGRPDLAFTKRRKVIFVHGCFWHRHPDCRRTTKPLTRPAFWEAKFARNVKRDSRNERALREQGWDVLVVWECETRDIGNLTS